MSVTGIIGTKINQKQEFLEDGTRVPVSVVSVKDVMITQVKKADRDGYNALQLAIGQKKRGNQPLSGHLKKAGLSKTPRFFREIRLDAESDTPVGSTLTAADVFKPGDIIHVTGVSKGKGYAGVVKRHHFRGGPRTHGQSDRERAPGSIGQTTTPGRVYRGKRMAGHMGHTQVTIKNLQILEVADDSLYIKGLIPGVIGEVVSIKKVGESKKFKPLFKKVDELASQATEATETAAEVEEKVDANEAPSDPVQETQEEVEEKEKEIEK